jgi:pyruvate kinase
MGYISLEDAQALLGIGDRISGIDIRCTKLEDSKQVRDDLREKLKDFDNIRVEDWRTLNASLFSAIMLEKVAMFTILTSIILVASFNILCLLIMMVIEKAREIAIFKAMGTTDQSVVGDQTKVAISYEDLTNDVQAGSHILIDDGLVELLVKEVNGKNIVCEVLNGGKVSNKKGVNVPNVDLTMEFISPKDKSDLIFACENDMDFIAASFTRTAQDIKDVRAILDANGGERIQIIAKIESMQGIDNIDEIIEAADGIMVARGDMGVEIPMEEVPVIQKMIIKKVYQAGKYVITATQMLDSMMNNPRPTRAEATDVANAIYDGTSAIMLSGETANGDYPVEAVKTMATIAARTEQDINYANRLRQRDVEENPTITDAVSHSACTMADDLNASAICTVTKSGRTAHYVAKYRPTAPIIAAPSAVASGASTVSTVQP